MFYLQKRVPKALVGHYGKEFIRKSLRRHDRVTAIRISSQLVTALEKEWSDKLFAMPDDVPATVFLSEPKHTVPVLSAALADYCAMKGRQDDSAKASLVSFAPKDVDVDWIISESDNYGSCTSRNPF